jgi:hypothetical protein
MAFITAIFSAAPSTEAANSSLADRKWLLGRQLALMCCSDMCPFDITEKPGFTKFLLQNSVIKDADELPSAVTVSHLGLLSVYDETLKKVREIISEAPKTVAMTTDLWSENHKRRSYATFTLHFSTADFCMHNRRSSGIPHHSRH